MSKSKKYVLSREVYKYPYCARFDTTDDYLSDKVSRGTVKIRQTIVRKTKRVFVYGKDKVSRGTIQMRQKIVRKTKRVFVYVEFFISLNNGLTPNQAVGLPVLIRTPSIMRSILSNGDLSKKAIIAQVIR